MKSRTVTTIIVFTAVAVVLNVIRVPTIYWSQNFYQFSQIPIVAAFILFGVKIGIIIGVLNWLSALTLFPLGLNGVVAYSMDLISLMIMFLGLYLAACFCSRRIINRRSNKNKLLMVLTGFATIFRGGIMPLVDYGVLYHVLLPLFFGITLPETVVLGLMPIFIIYNVTTILYTVPAAYLIAVKTGKFLNLNLSLVHQS
jgi:uncharacterized membrane protein